MGRIKRILVVILSLIMVITIVPEFGNYKQVKADDSFAITSPIDNSLVAAGSFDIKWNPATNSEVKYYEVYINDKSVGKTTKTSCECYTTSVKMFSVYVVAVYKNGSEQSSEKVKFGVTKKGLCVNNEMGRYLNPQNMNMGWYYNWSPTSFSNSLYRNIEFVPMIWGTGSESSIDSVAKSNYKYLLAYNEPDMVGNGGSNIPVETAISHWPKFLKGNYYLGSPAPAFSPSWDNGTWFRTFMVNIDHSTVDFIPLHCYYGQYGGADGANTFLREVVDKTYEMYGKPIWVTEFAVSGWGYSDASKRESVNEFLKTVIDGLNEREYVERYSWFSFDTTDEYNGASALWTNSNGKLTDLGKTYVSYGNPVGYSATPQEELGYNVSETVQETLLNDTVTINNIECSDYVNESGVQISASSELNGNIATNAVDNNIGSRWESTQGVDPQSITIDLGVIRNIKQVNIIWEDASASDYVVQVSSDGQTYKTVAQIEGASHKNKRCDTVSFLEMVSGRYVRVIGTSRTTQYGYSIYDMAVYGTDDLGANETTTAPSTTAPPVVEPDEIPSIIMKTDESSIIDNNNSTTRPEETTKPHVIMTTAPKKVTVKRTKVKKATKKKSSKKAKISLKKIKGAKGYLVKISTSKKFKKSKTVTKKFKKASFTFKSKKIKNKKKLYVKARAYKKVNGKTYYSKWSKRKKIRIKE